MKTNKLLPHELASKNLLIQCWIEDLTHPSTFSESERGVQWCTIKEYELYANNATLERESSWPQIYQKKRGFFLPYLDGCGYFHKFMFMFMYYVGTMMIHTTFIIIIFLQKRTFSQYSCCSPQSFIQHIADMD